MKFHSYRFGILRIYVLIFILKEGDEISVDLYICNLIIYYILDLIKE